MPTYPPTSRPITRREPVIASLVDPIPVPTHGLGGTFTVLAKSYVAAPPSVVLQTIRNTNEWHKWNSFCPRCVIDPKSALSLTPSSGNAALEIGKEGWLEVGTIAVLEVFMTGEGLVEGKKKSREQGIVVMKLEPLVGGRKGYMIAWKSTGFSHWQLHSERVMEFAENPSGGTDYCCWETFGGLLGSVVKATVGGQLVNRFGDYARDVKAFVEGGKAVAGEGEGVIGSI